MGGLDFHFCISFHRLMNTGVGGHATFLEVVAFHDNGWGGEKSNINPYLYASCSDKLQERLNCRLE